jgi:hypothetical protein
MTAVNDRAVLSLERAPLIDKTATLQQKFGFARRWDLTPRVIGRLTVGRFVVFTLKPVSL